MISVTFADGEALFTAVCEMGLEGVVAKRIDSTYGTSKRGWIKTNPTYWRRDLLEREATSRKRERARARLVR